MSSSILVQLDGGEVKVVPLHRIREIRKLSALQDAAQLVCDSPTGNVLDAAVMYTLANTFDDVVDKMTQAGLVVDTQN